MHPEVLPHVVIIGGGFGGLYAARALKRAAVRVTVIDRRNHHLFQPLLYQVATAGLSPADIAAPIRHVLRKQQHTRVLLAEVTEIDTQGREVVFGDGRRIHYDFLIVATGATHQYFGHDEWETFAPGLKTIEDAIGIRRRFLLAFEAAEQEPDAGLRRALLTFVVVGAGPTGVELAGAMAEIARHALVRDFRRIQSESATILLLEGGDRVLSAYPPELSESAAASLRRLGVEVRTDAVVTHIDESGVCIGDERIAARNVIWAAGVAASPLGASIGAPTDRVGRVLVEQDLSVPGHPEVFVIGDLAAFLHQTGEPLPGVAPVAMQQARAAAANIRATIEDRQRAAFHYRDKGSLATIGRASAVAEFGRVRISGALAWLAWLFIHILFLIGFANRLVVMIQWAYSYLTFQRGARLITGETGYFARGKMPPAGPHMPPAGAEEAARGEVRGPSVPS